jgi:transcriptional regulator with XRE-family HTH domain
MTLGEKIKNERIKIDLSQEELAQRLKVSRSAVAKWETDKGTPDIENLKNITQMLNVSIDYLLEENEKHPQHMDERYDAIIGKRCDIEVKGWNDGVFDALVGGQDSYFIYYQTTVKHKKIYGAVGKKYITAIKESKKQKDISMISIGKSYFVNRHVFIEQACKDGLLNGFFDFTNDDYLDVVIKEFTDEQIMLYGGNSIALDNITKIQEL